MRNNAELSQFSLKMRVITVEPVAFAYVFALAMLSPLLQQYIYEELGESYNFTEEEKKLCNNDTDVNASISRLEDLVQTKATRWFIGLSLSCKYVWKILQAIDSHGFVNALPSLYWKMSVFIFSYTTASLPSVFATFMYGSMSDSTGRKPVMLVATCGSFLRFLVVSMTVTFGMKMIFMYYYSNNI